MAYSKLALCAGRGTNILLRLPTQAQASHTLMGLTHLTLCNCTLLGHGEELQGLAVLTGMLSLCLSGCQLHREDAGASHVHHQEERNTYILFLASQREYCWDFSWLHADDEPCVTMHQAHLLFRETVISAISTSVVRHAGTCALQSFLMWLAWPLQGRRLPCMRQGSWHMQVQPLVQRWHI